MLWHGGVLCYPDGTPVAGVKNVPKPGMPVIGFIGANPPQKPLAELGSSLARAYAHRRSGPTSSNDRWGRSDREDGWFRFR